MKVKKTHIHGKMNKSSYALSDVVLPLGFFSRGMAHRKWCGVVFYNKINTDINLLSEYQVPELSIYPNFALYIPFGPKLHFLLGIPTKMNQRN